MYLVVFFLFGNSPASDFFCADFSEHCSIFIGAVNRKNFFLFTLKFADVSELLYVPSSYAVYVGRISPCLHHI